MRKPVSPLSPVAPTILRFAENAKGRDFVVGDIHGAYTLVAQAMSAVGFDPDADRLFCVGDLIDRGADSALCARFLSWPGVHSVRGNHEDMLLELYANGDPAPQVLAYVAQHNGFDWWLTATKEVRRATLDAIGRLPLAMEVETARGLVGLVHADVPAGMNWATFITNIEAGEGATVQTALWGRDRIQGGNEDGVTGIGRVFVGHTPRWGGLRRYGNVYAIDTGAVFGEQGRDLDGRLTFANVLSRTDCMVSRRPPVLVDIRVGAAESDVPFGAYARED